MPLTRLLHASYTPRASYTPYTPLTRGGTRSDLVARRRRRRGCGKSTGFQVLTLLTYLLYWYRSTNTDAAGFQRRTSSSISPAAASVYLLYWYRSTNTDVAVFQRATSSSISPVLPRRMTACVRFTYSVYLLYWYKRTNTDGEALEHRVLRLVVWRCAAGTELRY